MSRIYQAFLVTLASASTHSLVSRFSGWLANFPSRVSLSMLGTEQSQEPSEDSKSWEKQVQPLGRVVVLPRGTRFRW